MSLEHVDVDALRDELEIVVMDAVAGGPMSDKLLKTVRRVVEARVRRLVGGWVRGYEVTVVPDVTGTGLEVTVLLKTADATKRVRLGVNPMG